MIVDAQAKCLRQLLEDELGADFLAKPLATVAETARAVQKPQSSLYDTIGRGFPHVRAAGRIYCPPAAVAAWLLGQADAARAERAAPRTGRRSAAGRLRRP